jgi:hypothetical protein
MKQPPAKRNRRPSGETQMSEFLILPDGRILAHNLTPLFAGLLAGINPGCDQIAARVTSQKIHNHELSN